MSKHCKPGNCHAGMIGTRTIIESEWADELGKFLVVIDENGVRRLPPQEVSLIPGESDDDQD